MGKCFIVLSVYYKTFFYTSSLNYSYTPLLIYSTTHILHYSHTPLLTYSTTHILHYLDHKSFRSTHLTQFVAQESLADFREFMRNIAHEKLHICFL